MSWENLTDSLLRLIYKKSLHQKYSDHIAMFDLDGTLVQTTSGNIHPKNSSDWEWFGEESKSEKLKKEIRGEKARDEDIKSEKLVLAKLQELVEENYTIIIITNQAGMNKHPDILERIENIYRELSDQCDFSYFEIYIATSNDVYRKPNTAIFEKYMWPKIENIEKIFYVGDAAGRQDDFSDSDRKFAFNIHLFIRHYQPKEKKYPHVKFFTPDEFFKNERGDERIWRGINPFEYYQNANKNDDKEVNALIKSINNTDALILLIMIGPPASGKSRLADIIIRAMQITTTYINQDTCKTKTKCQNIFNEAIKQDTPHLIIIDNTNPSREVRENYINTAKYSRPKKKVIVKYIVMDESRELYEHLSVYRERIYFHDNGELIDKHIPTVAYNKYYKLYDNVNEDAGVDEILHFQFIPKFCSKYHIMMFLERS